MTTLDRWLRGIGLTGLFLVPFVPLYVSTSMFFPYITGKNFAFRIIILIAACASALLVLRRPEYRPKYSRVLVMVTAFLVIVGIADLFGLYPFRSFWSNYERMEGYVNLLHVFAFFLIALVLLTKERLWGWLMHTSLFVSLLLSGYGFLQTRGMFVSGQGGTRLDATFGNATYFAIYASLHVFFALFLLARARGYGKQFGYGVLALLNGIMLYYTATRGAILGLVAGVFVAGAIVALHHGGRVRKVAGGILAGIVVLVGVFLLARTTSFVQKSPVLSRFASISLTDRTTISRLTIWGMAYEGWKEHPILGWGEENFNLVFNKYYKTSLYDQEAWFDRAHNIYVEWFVAGGFLGGLAYLALFAVLFWELWRRRVAEGTVLVLSVTDKAILSGAVVAYMVNNFFVFDNLISLVLFFAILGVVHHATVGIHAPSRSEHSFGPQRFAVALLVVLATVVIFWRADVRPIEASRTLIAAMSPQEKGVVDNLRLYKEALALNTFGNPEIREQFVRFASQVRGASDKDVSAALKSEIIQSAVQTMQDQVRETPDDARYRLFLGNFYITIGDQDQAIRELGEAVRLSPGKQQMYGALTAAYINKGDVGKFLATAKYSYELDVSNQEALVNYAIAAIFAKDATLADGLIAKLNDKNVVANDQRFFQAYYLTKQYSKIAAIWEARVAANPKDAQSYTSLAAAYLMVGRRADAIRAIEQAMAIEPKFKDQGTQLITDIRAGKNPVTQ